MKKVQWIVFFGVMAAGLLVFSCTNGQYLGIEGGGEFIIYDRTPYDDRTEGRYWETSFATVEMTVGDITYQFQSESDTGKCEFKDGKASAKLCTAEGTIYEGSDDGVLCTVKLYDTLGDASSLLVKTFTVTFYNGGAIVSITETGEPL